MTAYHLLIQVVQLAELRNDLDEGQCHKIQQFSALHL